MPAYNAAGTLPESLESILQQSYRDFELVISDNASTDETLQICRHVASRDPRVRVVSQSRNLGSIRNYNVVATLATGTYFKWASSSDLLHPTFIESCLRVLEEDSACVLCFPGTRLFVVTPDDGVDYKEWMSFAGKGPLDRFREVSRNMRLNNVMNGLIRREVLERIGFHPEVPGGDMHMVAELCLHGTVRELPDVLLYRRMTPLSATALLPREEQLRHAFAESARHENFSTWRRYWGNVRAMLRSPLTVQDKARGLLLVVRQWYWVWPMLIHEVKEAFLRGVSGSR